MKTISVLLMALALFILASCKAVENQFIIRDPGNVISSAELKLCGESLNLTKSKGEMIGKMPITCEGEGRILISYLDGNETLCQIGYVTPSLQQNFEFVVKGGQCR